MGALLYDRFKVWVIGVEKFGGETFHLVCDCSGTHNDLFLNVFLCTVCEMLLDKFTNGLLVACVKKCVKLIDDKSAKISNKYLFSRSPIFKTFKCSDQAINTLLELSGLNFMTLS
jgi:hypothetical protein